MPGIRKNVWEKCAKSSVAVRKWVRVSSREEEGVGGAACVHVDGDTIMGIEKV